VDDHSDAIHNFNYLILSLIQVKMKSDHSGVRTAIQSHRVNS